MSTESHRDGDEGSAVNSDAPPYDAELAAVLAVAAQEMTPVTIEDLPRLRARDQDAAVQAREAVLAAGLAVEDVTIPAGDRDTVEMSIIHRPDTAEARPLFYFIHGGGMILGNRWNGHEEFIKWIDRYDAVVATIDYRLAPEHRFPTPQEDCYAGLVWLDQNAQALRAWSATGLVIGTSAGGGLAAAVALMARDRMGPSIGGMMLLAPMLDDRPSWPSWQQFPTGVWSAGENRLAWSALLGRDPGLEDVSHHAAPGRTPDHGNLPTTYVEVGSAELFRDESVAFASGIWAAGGRAELHVWDGGFHGFDSHVHTALAQGATEARLNWMDRMLGFPARRSR
jgi:acetyl esterase/lipase